MHRKLLVFALFSFLAAGCQRLTSAPAPDAPAARPKVDPANWAAFKTAFLRPEGRVVDTFNGNVSHSEGQGYGMILAEAAEDRATFDLLWTWTRAHLQTRPADKLLSWRWRPDADDPATGHVDDPNNATDGDLLVAWALARAADHWKETSYADAARALCRDIRGKLVRPTRFGPVLLPGAVGFENAEGLVLNLSYWVFPAFPALMRLENDPTWQRLADSGTELLARARFGPAGLPPDWLLLPAGPPTVPPLRPAPDQPFVHGYNAVRIPLYLAWRERPRPELLAPFQRFWKSYSSPADVPATVGLTTGAPGPDRGMAGAQAITRWLLTPDFHKPEPDPPMDPQQGYYSGVLRLLTEVAQRETSATDR